MIPIFGFLLIAVLLIAGVFGWLRWFAVADRPDGERYPRTRMQGPFVPGGGRDDSSDVRHPRTHLSDEAR